ncbi:MAG: HDOD domain-containing protein [Planctomycetota bacterium]
MTSPMQASSHDLASLVQGAVGLPTLPEVVGKLNKLLESDSASAGDVAKVLQSDPAVAVNMLRMVNSAHYGLVVRIASIPLAVSVLGFATTRRVALRAAVFTAFATRREKIANFDPTGFWRHSIFVGIAARTLAAASPTFIDLHPEDAYMAGLLHDVGKILMLEKCGPRYVAALQRGTAEGLPDGEVERLEFGFTHAEVGSVLAHKWSLPEDLAEAIRYHHAPQRSAAFKPLASLVHLADRLAWLAAIPSTEGTVQPPSCPEAYEHVGLPADLVDELLPAVREAFADAEMPW